MFFWFVGTAIATVWFVFRDPRFDYRLLVVGSVLPLGDALFGGLRVMHTLAFSLALLVGIMLATVGHRSWRRLWLGLPIATLLHLVFDGAWADSDVFWWPVGGWGFGDAPLPEAARGWWNVPLESSGWRSWRGSGGRPGFRIEPGERRRGAPVGCSPRPPPEPEDRGSLSAVLILVRHGRTTLNAEGRLQGRLDVPLDDVGREQAKAVVAHVGAVDELISSPLRRATETAEFFGQPYVTDERWIELAYGPYEGTAYTDIPSEAWDHWKANVSWAPDGGESLTTLAERVRAACLALADRARDHDVVVVTHVSPMKAAVAWVLGAGIEISWRSHLSHASVCRIDMREGGPVLFTFNEVAR